MSRILRVGLIALSCAVLSWFGGVRGADSNVTQRGVTVEPQNLDTASSDGTGGTPHERWKSCAELIHPGGSYSASDLQARFEQPANIEQMLRNLKLAGDEDWLLQPHFFDSQTLLRFFSGSKVTWNERKPDPLSKDVAAVAADIDSRIFPQLKVSVEANCWLTKFQHPDGRVEKTAAVGGNIRIYGGPIPAMTLRVVRNVLGRETENMIDHGTTYEGPDYTPTGKGRIVYANRAGSQLEGRELGMSFNFAPGPPRKPGEPLPREIVADDVVQTIVLTEVRHRNLEN